MKSGGSVYCISVNGWFLNYYLSVVRIPSWKIRRQCALLGLHADSKIFRMQFMGIADVFRTFL